MRFHTNVELGGKTATGFVVPAEVVDGLASGKRPAVVVTVNGHSYRSTVASMGGRYMLPLAAVHREAAGLAAGDEVDVDVELDTAPRTVEVPADFAEALAADPKAQAFFSGLSYSQQRWFVTGIEQAKKPETRLRRIATAVERLHDERGQR